MTASPPPCGTTTRWTARSGAAAFVGGGNLGALLADEPRQPVAEVRRLLGDIADALRDL